MIKAILTDIEGTTTALSYVKDVLFPYARAQIPGFVRQRQQEAPIEQLLADTCSEAGIDFNVENAIGQLIEWIDQDRKITPLKALQGLIWEAGYRQGDFKGHVYRDAFDKLTDWNERGIALYVYSSGSVLAQKLLFGHSDFGDLTPLFSGFFDTHIGGKKEAESYRKIAAEIGLPPENILFLSDIEEELDAAKAKEFRTYWLIRGRQPDADPKHPQARTFIEIKPD